MATIDLTQPASNKKLYFFAGLFQRDYQRYEGVPRINIYLLRLLFGLTFLFVGMDSWTTIVNFNGSWDPVRAVAFCVWAAYSTLSFLGLLHPLRMLPIVIFQIFYKVLWLSIVAYPLWMTNKLAGSSAEQMTYAFLWIPLAILAMPWSYFIKNYVVGRKK